MVFRTSEIRSSEPLFWWQPISWYSGLAFSESFPNEVFHCLASYRHRQRLWKHSEVDLQWLRTHVFRSPLEKDPIDHVDSESPWQWGLQTPSSQVPKHQSFVGDTEKSWRKRCSGSETLELKGSCKDTGILFGLDANFSQRRQRLYVERFVLQWNWGILLWYTRWPCGILSTGDSASQVGEPWRGTRLLLRPQEASEVPAKCKQYRSVINFSFTDLIWAEQQEADANFCFHPRAIRPRAFSERGSSPPFSCWSERWRSSLSPWPVLLLVCFVAHTGLPADHATEF